MKCLFQLTVPSYHQTTLLHLPRQPRFHFPELRQFHLQKEVSLYQDWTLDHLSSEDYLVHRCCLRIPEVKQIFRTEKKKQTQSKIWDRKWIFGPHCSNFISVVKCRVVQQKNCYISSGVDCKLLVSLDQRVFLVWWQWLPWCGPWWCYFCWIVRVLNRSQHPAIEFVAAFFAF